MRFIIDYDVGEGEVNITHSLPHYSKDLESFKLTGECRYCLHLFYICFFFIEIMLLCLACPLSIENKILVGGPLRGDRRRCILCAVTSTTTLVPFQNGFKICTILSFRAVAFFWGEMILYPKYHVISLCISALLQ